MRRRWLRLTDEEIARVRLLLSRDSTRLIEGTYNHDDPDQSIADWDAVWANGRIIERIDSLYRKWS